MSTCGQRDNVQVTAAVVDLIGAEQVEHLRTTAGAVTGQCWSCEQAVDGTREPVAILALQPEGSPTLTLVNLAHPTCAPSAVHQVRNADVLLRRLEQQVDSDGTDVTAVTTVWPVPTDDGPTGPEREHTPLRPIVLMSFAGSPAMLTDSGERIDLVAQELLRQGWHLVSGMDAEPPPLPTGWRLRYQIDPSRTDVPGTLEILDPTGEPLAGDIPLLPAPLWVYTALAAGSRTSIYVGPLHLEHTWAHRPDIAVVDQAIHAGALVGGVVDVELRA